MALTKVRGAGLGTLSGDTTTVTLEDTSSHSANTGPAISFKSKDSGGTTREVAKIVGESHSGTDEGNLALQTRNGGTLETKWKLFKNGNFIPTNSAYGIVLGNTTSTDANLLDDYEEGTFTATMSNSVTLNSSPDLVSYTKVGRMVTVGGQILIDNANSGAATEINNLPFASTSGSEDSNYYVGSVRLYNFDVPSDCVSVVCYTGGGSSNITFVNNRDNASSSSLAADSGGYLMFTITYFAA